MPLLSYGKEVSLELADETGDCVDFLKLDKGTVQFPSAITPFFACPLTMEEEKNEEVDENSDLDELENEILAYLNQRLNDDGSEETFADSDLFASVFLRLE